MKRYDRAYFDKWYRNPRHAITTRSYLERKVHLALATAEFFLGREVNTVLDVGCGEGAWFVPLRAMRPDLRYTGIDSSEYAVKKFGESRNIRPGSFGQLQEQRFDTTFDLVVCSDVLHYVKTPELVRGVSGLKEILEGVAFLEVFTSKDELVGDLDGYIARAPGWYRKEFAKAGLVPCGPHSYLGPRLAVSACAMETFSAG
ncbi:MAG TPA: class I SAM-dependent methyltransferase [Thermoanaerobaculia bacterium]|nr:class I SAM-dependent methyltransferase [Thermoanaerobaculia bacterium]